MGVIISCVFDSFDEAEYISIKLKNSVQGIRIIGISANTGRETHEERFYPAVNTTAFTNSTFNNTINGGLIYPFFAANVFDDDNRDFEPALRREVILQIEAEKGEDARRVSKFLVSSGAREIRMHEKS